jgi:hypothetical protein
MKSREVVLEEMKDVYDRLIEEGKDFDIVYMTFYKDGEVMLEEEVIKVDEEELQYYKEKVKKMKLLFLKLRIKTQLILKKAISTGITVSEDEINEVVESTLKK